MRYTRFIIRQYDLMLAPSTSHRQTQHLEAMRFRGVLSLQRRIESAASSANDMKQIATASLRRTYSSYVRGK